jgi:hypothetical protein
LRHSDSDSSPARQFVHVNGVWPRDLDHQLSPKTPPYHGSKGVHAWLCLCPSDHEVVLLAVLSFSRQRGPCSVCH